MSIISIIVALIAFGITASLGIIVIPYLRKLKFGQTILDIGPKWHIKKQGTPTMGGILFAVGTVIAFIIGFALLSADGKIDYEIGGVQAFKAISGLIMAIAFCAIGFIDDYIKVVKKRNLGLTARQKIIMQILVSTAYLTSIYFSGDNSTILKIPFLGQLDLGLFYYPISVLLIIFIVNAVNLTDGIDGLCTSVTFIYSVVFLVICNLLEFFALGNYAVALAGACLGFLVWNFHPAKVFMGDTGSFFLGGSVVALAFGAGLHILVLIAGIIYVIEAGSVILQVVSFKTTGKRIFKMSPIHHHFEMSEWSELKIVWAFCLITLIAGGIAIALTYGL